MAKNINELERNFYKQRDTILKALKAEDAKLKKDYGTLLKQLNALKAKQNKVYSMDRAAKKSLAQMKTKLVAMHKQELLDSASIKFMQARITSLKKERPTIERAIRKSVPEMRKLARMDRGLERVLKPLNKKIAERQSAIEDLRAKMKKLGSKEAFIKRGVIVWGEFRKHIKKKKRPAAKQAGPEKGQSGERKGFFDVFKRK
jgi:chromosome segregation ATPase